MKPRFKTLEELKRVESYFIRYGKFPKRKKLRRNAVRLAFGYNTAKG